MGLLSWKLFYWIRETFHKVSSREILQTLWTTPGHYILFSTGKESSCMLDYVWSDFCFHRKFSWMFECLKGLVCGNSPHQYSKKNKNTFLKSKTQEKNGQSFFPLFCILLKKLLQSHSNHPGMYHNLQMLATIFLWLAIIVIFDISTWLKQSPQFSWPNKMASQWNGIYAIVMDVEHRLFLDREPEQELWFEI